MTSASRPALVAVNPAALASQMLPWKDVGGAWMVANDFLAAVPSQFDMTSHGFYSIVNQRNLSGLVGEALTFALDARAKVYSRNPHPDGRPDLIDLSTDAARGYYSRECFDDRNAPIRSALAPFQYGGLEVKATIGDIDQASMFDIGDSRIDNVKGINYWAHHRHECTLLGIYYDFASERESAPQIRALFLAELEGADWAKVSTGRSDRKKTSNTSLLKSGKTKVAQGLVGFVDLPSVRALLERLGCPGV